ncbi:MAG TPA: amidase [Steroidobacteraceae bacterium]|jgi:amidase|nr:amidase [Steroidobacteraceae bacterium]
MTNKTVFLVFGVALLLSPFAHACDSKEKAGPLDLSTATLPEITAALEQKKVSSVDLVRGYLERIANCDPKLHAIIATNPNAMREAERLDRERKAGKLRGPLHGIPVIIKDNIDLAGAVTTAGSLALANNLRTRNAPLVDRLTEAGVIVIAKANLSEWANIRSGWSSSGWSAVGGLAVNPLNPQRTACGSSSGSGVAVAAHFAPLAVGTETDGSVTCPASVTGLVGLKPTVGLISGAGIVPISHTQDTAGPMAATVQDAATLLTALAESRGKAPRTNYSAGLDAGALKGVRLGVARFIKGFSPPTEKAFNEALEVLKAQGAVLVEIDKFDFADLGDLELTILLTELKADLNAYLATTPESVKTRTLADVIAFNNAEPREMIWFGQELFEQAQATGGLSDPKYTQALQKAHDLAGAQGIDRLLREHQVVALVAPTYGPAWTIDLVNGDHSPASSTQLPAVSGYPHLTVPMGQISGLPVGLSFFGAAWSEQKLLSLGYSFEQAQRAP